MNNPVNSKGIKLLDRYKELFIAIREYDNQIVQDVELIRHYFLSLSEYPFNDVNTVMSEYVRQRLKGILGLATYPYSDEQKEAIEHLKTLYATDVAFYKGLDDLNLNALLVINAVDTKAEFVTTFNTKPYQDALDNALRLIYQLDKNYLWYNVDKLVEVFTKLNTFADNSSVKIKAALTYLFNVLERKESLRLNYVVDQFVKDFVTTLSFDTLHPDVAKALEVALNVQPYLIQERLMPRYFFEDVLGKSHAYIKATKSLFDNLTPTTEEEDKLSYNQHVDRLIHIVKRVESGEPLTLLRQDLSESLTYVLTSPYSKSLTLSLSQKLSLEAWVARASDILYKGE